MIGGDAQTSTLIGNLLRNLRTCSAGRITPRRGRAGPGMLGDVSSPTFEYVCPSRNCDATSRPHIHIFTDGTGAGWPTGGENRFIDATDIDAAMESLNRWKTNDGNPVTGDFTANGWSETIDCVINTTIQQTGYAYPLTYADYIRDARTHIPEVIESAVEIDGTFDRKVYTSIERRGTLLQSLINLSLLTAGGTSGPIKLTMSTPARRTANLPTFYEHLAKLMVIVNKTYDGVEEYCNTRRLLSATQKSGILKKTTKKISNELGRLITGRDHDIKHAVSTLGSISRPANADPLCVGEHRPRREGEQPDDEGGRRRTRRRHGRRRTQKKKA